MDIFNMPGYHQYEYLLVIDIPESLRHKIEKARQELADHYHIRQPKTGRPHIGLVRFTAFQQGEEKIIDRLQAILMAQGPFLTELSGFGGYPMHALFINISRQERIKGLVKALKEARPLMKAGGEAPHFLEDPVIPLAARMDKNIYIAAMKEYAHRHFSGRFVASSVLMLKRKQKNERYQVVKRFELEHLPVGARQQELF